MLKHLLQLNLELVFLKKILKPNSIILGLKKIMSGSGKTIVIYVISFAVILLGMRPFLYAQAKVPFHANWNMNAEEEEENKKGSSEKECDNEEKITVFQKIYGFMGSELAPHQNYNSYIKDHFQVAYPGPPPQA